MQTTTPRAAAGMAQTSQSTMLLGLMAKRGHQTAGEQQGPVARGRHPMVLASGTRHGTACRLQNLASAGDGRNVQHWDKTDHANKVLQGGPLQPGLQARSDCLRPSLPLFSLA